MRAFLRAHNINLNIFFDDAEEAREFAKDKVCTSYYFMAAFPQFGVQGMNHFGQYGKNLSFEVLLYIVCQQCVGSLKSVNNNKLEIDMAL